MISMLLSTLGAGLLNIFPMILNLIDKWMTVKKDIQLKSMEIELAKYQGNLQKDFADIVASLREGESVREHDSSLTDTGFIGGLRASVRPIITYMFFFFFLLVKGLAVYNVISVDHMPWNQALPLIWDESTQVIFGAILGFWFGGRLIEKAMNLSAPPRGKK